MKVTVTGSLGNISRILVEKLVASGHEVKVVSSNIERAKEIEKLKAIPLIGLLEDYDFIQNSFQGSDAVYLMIPPAFKATDINQYIKTISGQYAKAVKEHKINYVINLSSILSSDAINLGVSGANHFAEAQLNALENVNVMHLRPGLFMTNFYGAISTLKHESVLGNNFEGGVILPLTHPRDIAHVAFKALDNLSFSGIQIQYIVSDEKNGFEVAKALGNAVGKPHVNWVAFSDEQLLSVLVQSGFTEPMAKIYFIESGIALREGIIMEEYRKHKSETRGETTLQDFAKEFAIAYQFNS